MIPLIPAGVAFLVCTSFAIKVRKQKPMTKEQREIYHSALKEIKDPEKLEKLAKEYRRRGFKLEGLLLEKRAAWSRLPAEQKAEFRTIVKKALKSKNRDLVLGLADEYERMGCTGCAYNLRRYGQHLLQQQQDLPESKTEGA